MNVQLNIEALKAKDCAFLSILDTSFYPVAPTSAEIEITNNNYGNWSFDITGNDGTASISSNKPSSHLFKSFFHSISISPFSFFLLISILDNELVKFEFLIII